MTNLIAWITRALIFGSVMMYGAVGEILTEKVGHLNLGTPGIMAIGGGAGFIAAFLYENGNPNPNVVLCLLITLVCGFAAGMLAGALYSFLTVTMSANQNVTGLTLTIFGVGLAKFFCAFVIPAGKTSIKATFGNSIFAAPIFPFYKNLGWFGEMFLSYGFMMYLAIIIAVAVTLFLKKTRVGLNLRSVGESPATADAAGINVTKYKYLSICIGSGFTGLGGVYYVLGYNNGSWSTAAAGDIESLGWLAVALVIFATWKTVNAIWGAYLFGLCYWSYQYIGAFIGFTPNTDITRMLPYVVTIIVLIVVNFRKKKENQPPASLGMSYFREDR